MTGNDFLVRPILWCFEFLSTLLTLSWKQIKCYSSHAISPAFLLFVAFKSLSERHRHRSVILNVLIVLPVLAYIV